jgi:hypothetical protein
MAQQAYMPLKEVHWFNKSRCLEVTRNTEHYYGRKIIHRDIVSLEYAKTAIGVLIV